MSSADKFYGTWILIPELSIYQQGEPPRSGKYLIQEDGEKIVFEIEWTDATGKEFQLAFGGPLDGQKHSVDTPGISDVLYQKIDHLSLESIAYNDESVLLYARRAASADGSLLSVSQVSYTDSGSVTNLQVYRRDGS